MDNTGTSLFEPLLPWSEKLPQLATIKIPSNAMKECNSKNRTPSSGLEPKERDTSHFLAPLSLMSSSVIILSYAKIILNHLNLRP